MGIQYHEHCTNKNSESKKQTNKKQQKKKHEKYVLRKYHKSKDMKMFAQRTSEKIIIIILLIWEFFTSALVGLPLEFEWQQVSSSLQDSSQYSVLSLLILWFLILLINLSILWGLFQVLH